MNSQALAAYPQAYLGSRPHRLLVVEDDLDMRPIFELVGGSVPPHLLFDWAENVPDAIDRMNRESYDLVVCDFLLDGRGSGLSLKAWCDYNQPTTRFAMMSAFPIADALVDTSPPSAFLRKPFTLAQLRRFLDALLTSSPSDP